MPSAPRTCGPYDPLARLPAAAAFRLSSQDLVDGAPLKPPQRSGIFGVPGGEDRSPQLSWADVPAGTRSYAVTVYDPDAPTGAGFWHWAVANIPDSTHELPGGAGDEDTSKLPHGAIQLRNDASMACYLGAAPPAGDGPHRYLFVVHALDTEDLGVDQDATPSFLGFSMAFHTLGRAVILGTAETKLEEQAR